MIAQRMKQKGWIEFTREAPEPWLWILSPGEQALAAHRAVAKAEIDLDTHGVFRDGARQPSRPALSIDRFRNGFLPRK
jgi:hypothetical protein